MRVYILHLFLLSFDAVLGLTFAKACDTQHSGSG